MPRYQSAILFALLLTTFCAPASAAPDAKSCISRSQEGFREVKGQSMFVVTLTNTCQRTLNCRINFNISTAFGSKFGVIQVVATPRTSRGPSRTSGQISVNATSGQALLARNCSFAE